MTLFSRIREGYLLVSVGIVLMGITIILKNYIGDFFFQFFMVITFLFYLWITIKEIRKILKFQKVVKIETENIVLPIFWGLFIFLALIQTEYRYYLVFWYSKAGFGLLLILNTLLKIFLNKLYENSDK